MKQHFIDIYQRHIFIKPQSRPSQVSSPSYLSTPSPCDFHSKHPRLKLAQHSSTSSSTLNAPEPPIHHQKILLYPDPSRTNFTSSTSIHNQQKMGNLCGKQSSDAFAQPGRTLSSAPPAQNQNQTSSVPKKVVVGGPARTLGSGGGSGSSAQEDARRKAAEAAEVSDCYARRAQEMGS